MATYSSPTGAAIRAATRLQGQAYGITDGALETELATRVTAGEDEVFARVGEGYRTSTITDPQSRILAKAVSYRAGLDLLQEMLVDRVGGTFEPLLVAEPADIERLIEIFTQRVQDLEALFLGAGQSVNSTPAFAKPGSSSGTFSVTSTDRTPADRALLQDERDNVGSWDDDNG